MASLWSRLHGNRAHPALQNNDEVDNFSARILYELFDQSPRSGTDADTAAFQQSHSCSPAARTRWLCLRTSGCSAGADDVLDELLADTAPSKQNRPTAKAARKRRIASPAELARSPLLRRVLSDAAGVWGPLPNVVAPAERPAMLQRIDELRRSLAADTDADGPGLLHVTGGASEEISMEAVFCSV